MTVTNPAALYGGAFHELLTIVKGFRNGAVYGAKVRFPHALVMTFLFRTGTLESKIRAILKATYMHGRNLALFVTIFKSLLLAFRLARGRERSLDAFIAGGVGGYMVFGIDNNINHQIVLYLLARVVLGSAKLVQEQVGFKTPRQAWPAFASLVWATVMWLFRHRSRHLQSSLRASMQYLYNDSDKFHDLRTLLWHNR